MALISSFSFEGQTPDADLDFSETPGWFGNGGSTLMTASADAAMHGALGGLIENADSYRAVRYTLSEESRTSPVSLDCYVRFVDNIPEQLTYLMSLTDAPTGGSTISRADMRINANGTVVLRNSTIATATSTETLEADTWYRLSWHVEGSVQTLRVFLGDSTVQLFEISGEISNNSHTLASFGLITASAGTTVHFDSLRVADEWLDPVSPQIPLDTPENFTFVASLEEVAIDAAWDAVADAGGYELRLERLVAGSWEPVDIFPTPELGLTLLPSNGLLEGTQYRGSVRATP